MIASTNQDETEKETEDKQSSGQRPGSKKRKKKVTIHRNKVIQPEGNLPEGARFKGYRDYVVQDIVIKANNIRYRLAYYQLPDGSTVEVNDKKEAVESLKKWFNQNPDVKAKAGLVMQQRKEKHESLMKIASDSESDYDKV